MPDGGPGPVALVTGAGSGIGRAAATALAREGYRVACTDRDADAAEETAAALGGEVLGMRCDVGVRADLDRIVEAILYVWGSVDCLVNVAGVMCIAPAEEISEEAWASTLSINVGGALRAAQAAFEPLRLSPRASIVNVTSISNLRGQPGLVAYAASKAALESLTRTLAVEWAPHGIRVNSVAPGHVMTPMVQAALDDGSLPQSDLEGWERRIPLGHRLASSGEIADAIVFLAGPRAGYITGQSLVVDGALTVNGSYS